MRSLRAVTGGLLLVAVSAFSQDSVLRLTEVRESLTGTHHHYRQLIDGHEVVGAGRTITFWRDGRRDVHEQVADGGWRMSEVDSGLRHPPSAIRSYLNVHGVARPVARHVVGDGSLERHAVYIDEATGEVLRREPLFFTAKGRVFPANPVAFLNLPALQDQNDAAEAVPPAAYRNDDLLDLEPAGELRGPHVAIVDTDLPATARADPTRSLLFDRSQEQFEEVNVYSLIDRNQRYVQSLGYAGSRSIARYPIPVDPHAAGGSDTSYYIQAAAPGRGLLYFGDGGTDDAEDGDLVLHEYAHALHDSIAPGTFGGAVSSQSRAIAEGFADYWAFSSTYDDTASSGRDPFCIADWDARCWTDNAPEQCAYPPGADCLRRVDSTKTMAGFNTSEASGTEHRNGEIWSSALREIFVARVGSMGLEKGKRHVDTLALESMFGAPPNPTFRAIAVRMMTVDRLLGGASAAVICQAMSRRGIVATSECGEAPRGEFTHLQSPHQGVPINAPGASATLRISDPRAIEKLYVFVDIAHPSRGDLRIVLIAPDGVEYVLQEVTNDRTRDVRATYGLDAAPAQALDALRGRPAAGEWLLRVEDRIAPAEGILRSWSLVIQFAGDSPFSARPGVRGSAIPVAGHLIGADGRRFLTDLRLYNASSQAASAVLIFTPDGADGISQFNAVRVELMPHQIAAFDDIVAQLFRSSGLGWIEVTSGSPLFVSSRSYAAVTAGTFGAYVRSQLPLIQPQLPLGYIQPLMNTPELRSSIGFTETSGAGGVLRVDYYDLENGERIAENVVAIAPFTHVHLPVPVQGASLAEVRLIEGEARVIGYGSTTDNRTGDVTFIRAEFIGAQDLAFFYAPVANVRGASGTRWRTDISVTNLTAQGPQNLPVTLIDGESGRRTHTVVPTAAGPRRAVQIQNVGSDFVDMVGLVQLVLPRGTTATSKTYAEGGSSGAVVEFTGSTTKVVGLFGSAYGTLLHIESSAAFRTNIGVANLGSEVAHPWLVLHDAMGNEAGRRLLTLAPLQLVQIPVSSMIPGELVNGRASIEISSASADLLFYASVIDNRSGDPMYVPAQ